MVRVIVIGIFLVFIVGWLAFVIGDFMLEREWRFTWVSNDKTYKIEQIIIMQELDMVVLKMREKGTKKERYLRCKMENYWDWIKERRYKG